jgi:hypothetical protein
VKIVVFHFGFSLGVGEPVHGLRHPQEMGVDEVKAFLSHLATQMQLL